MSLLVLDGVGRRFGAVAALDDVSLAVAEGGRLAVVGPSGSGKTTLLRLVAGFEAPDSGHIRLAGEMVAEPSRIVPAHRRGIGLVAQDGALFPHLSVHDNIGFGLPRRDPGRDARIAELMAMVELDPAMARRRPDQLSGGQQQRVALARALALRPRLLLLDEPFSALDVGLRAEVRAVVASALARAGAAAILVTHDREEALSFADAVAVLDRGRLLQLGPPRELYWHPADATVAAMLGEALLLPALVRDGMASCPLGDIPVVDAARSGAATLMLRPEQLILVRDARGPVRVADVQFAGPAQTLVLEVDGRRHVLRSDALFQTTVGEYLRVGVTKPAHIVD